MGAGVEMGSTLASPPNTHLFSFIPAGQTQRKPSGKGAHCGGQLPGPEQCREMCRMDLIGTWRKISILYHYFFKEIIRKSFHIKNYEIIIKGIL